MKRIVFRLKPEPPDNREEIQEWKSYRVKEYPKIPTWLHFAGFAILGLGIGIGYRIGHPGIGFLAGFVAVFILVIVVHPLRCPECRGSVNPRDVDEENGFKRVFHDCPVCRISWRDPKRRHPNES